MSELVRLVVISFLVRVTWKPNSKWAWNLVEFILYIWVCLVILTWNLFCYTYYTVYNLEIRYLAKIIPLHLSLRLPNLSITSDSLQGNVNIAENIKTHVLVFSWRPINVFYERNREYGGVVIFYRQLVFQSVLQAWHQCLCVETGKSYPSATFIKETQ